MNIYIYIYRVHILCIIHTICIMCVGETHAVPDGIDSPIPRSRPTRSCITRPTPKDIEIEHFIADISCDDQFISDGKHVLLPTRSRIIFDKGDVHDQCKPSVRGDRNHRMAKGEILLTRRGKGDIWSCPYPLNRAND
jgi:hypothetical protein